MSIQRQIFANYLESVSKLQLTDLVETLISSANLVKVKGQAKRDSTLLIREAATGTTYTLEFNEESPLLNGSAGIYCTKDPKESVVSLTITEYTFSGYSETGDSSSIIRLDPFNSPVYSSLASLPLATANGGKPWNCKVVVSGQYEIEYSSDGATWYGRGRSALLANRPSAISFGIGEWTVGGTIKYFCDGTNWIVLGDVSKTLTGSRSSVLSDSDATLISTSASAVAFTIENDVTIGWGDSPTIVIFQLGAGANSFAAGSGVTLLQSSGFVNSSIQYDYIAAKRVGANAWALS